MILRRASKYVIANIGSYRVVSAQKTSNRPSNLTHTSQFCSPQIQDKARLGDSPFFASEWPFFVPGKRQFYVEPELITVLTFFKTLDKLAP